MENISKFIKHKFFSTTVLLSVFSILMGALLLIGYEHEEDELSDEAILHSLELKEYIVAGADLLKSLAVFECSLNKVDSSMLKVTFNEDGKKVQWNEILLLNYTL